MAWEAEKESRLLVHLLLLQISLYPIMSWIPGAGLHRWYFWLNYIEVAEMIFSTLWNVRIKLLSLPPQHNSMERWDGTLTSVKKPWIFAKNPVNPFLSRGHTARLEQNLSPHKSTHPDNFMLVLFPEEAAGFTHTCHPSPAPAAQPPELQNTNRNSHGCSLEPLQAHLPQPCSAPQGPVPWWAGWVWWIVSAWWNVPSHWTRSQMHSRAGSAAALIQAGCSQPVHKTEQKNPISLVPKACLSSLVWNPGHFAAVIYSVRKWCD